MNFPSTYKKTPNCESPSKHKLKVCKFVIQYLVVSYWKNTELEIKTTWDFSSDPGTY